MKYYLLLTLFSIIFFSLDHNASALEYKPLVSTNANGTEITEAVIGKPILFQYDVSNEEAEPVDFAIKFTTFTPDDNRVDEQTKTVHLKPKEAQTVTYQFVPTKEGNYIVSGFIESYGVGMSIAFPALDPAKNYEKKTVMMYSNSSDSDCLVACTNPSDLTINVGTVVEWLNTSPDYHSISTAQYKEEENGISLSYDKRFQSHNLGPDGKFSFLFLEPGEYQYFIWEHRLHQVVGMIQVLLTTHPSADKTIDVLQGIMKDENSIPITSLHVNPKNSIITVGIDDRYPNFTLETYKKSLYKKVGNVYLNIVSNYVKDEFSPQKLLDKSRQTIVSAQEVIGSPLNQFKSGIPIYEIKCKDELVLLTKASNDSPICVKPKTANKLIERVLAYETFPPSNSITEKQNKSTAVHKPQYGSCPVSFMDTSQYKPPKSHSDVISEPPSSITAMGTEFSSFEEAKNDAGLQDIFLPTYLPDCLKLHSIRINKAIPTGSFTTIVYLLDDIEPRGYFTENNVTENGLFISIQKERGLVYSLPINFVQDQARENKDLGWNYTVIKNSPVLLKNRNANFNLPTEADMVFVYQSIQVSSKILEIEEIEKITRSMFEYN